MRLRNIVVTRTHAHDLVVPMIRIICWFIGGDFCWTSPVFLGTQVMEFIGNLELHGFEGRPLAHWFASMWVC